MNSVFLAALLPIMLVLVAGVALIVYLRNKSEGDRYQHRSTGSTRSSSAMATARVRVAKAARDSRRGSERRLA
jgi:uncharacterized membrane protein